MHNSLRPDATFYLKAAEPQSDGSIVCTLVCPDPGESVDGLHTVVLSPAEVATLSDKSTSQEFEALLRPKVEAVAASLRPPVAVAAAMLAAVGGYTDVVEKAPPVPVQAVDADTGQPLTYEDGSPVIHHVEPGVYEGGVYTGVAFTV